MYTRTAWCLLFLARVTLADDSPNREDLLEVFINQEKQANVTLFIHQDGKMLVRDEDIKAWRLQSPQSAPTIYDQEKHYALESFSGLSYSVDPAAQRININAPAGLFAKTSLVRRPLSLPPTPSPWGGFANYAFSGQNNMPGSFFVEGGVFNAFGAGNSQFLIKDLEQRKLLRLNTTFVHDQPGQMQRWQIGDVVSSSRAGLPLFGLQLQRQFNLQPHFVSFPLPNVSGQALSDSSVDVYINNALALHDDVPAGEFTIEGVPVAASHGEIKLVLKDLFGGEHVSAQAFTANTHLLKPGLHEYSYEMGFLREQLGQENTNYGHFLVTGRHRLGLTHNMTGDVSMEWTPEQYLFGMGGVWQKAQWGTARLGIAGSDSSHGVGGLARVTLSSDLFTHIGFYSDTQVTTTEYVQLGQADSQLPARLSQLSMLSLHVDDFGSLSVRYSQRNGRNEDNSRFISAYYSRTFGATRTLFSCGLNYNPQDTNKTSVSLGLSQSLGSSTQANMTLDPQQNTGAIALERNLSSENGLGYRLSSSRDSSRNYNQAAQISAQNNVGIYSAGLTRNADNQLQWNAYLSGGVATINQHVFFSRPITDSFAAVQAADFEGVRVYANNHLVGTTNHNGQLLVPQIQAYQSNNISLEQADLPLNAAIDDLNMQAIPYARSGLLLKFPVKRVRNATLTIVLDNGAPLPAGSWFNMNDQTTEFPTGKNGEIFLAEALDHNTLTVHWQDQLCIINVDVPASTDPLPDLGAYVCKGIKP